MSGNLRWTAALTSAFSAGVPNCDTRANAFLACASSGIGYFPLPPYPFFVFTAKSLFGKRSFAFRESFAMLAVFTVIDIAEAHQSCTALRGRRNRTTHVVGIVIRLLFAQFCVLWLSDFSDLSFYFLFHACACIATFLVCIMRALLGSAWGCSSWGGAPPWICMAG